MNKEFLRKCATPGCCSYREPAGRLTVNPTESIVNNLLTTVRLFGNFIIRSNGVVGKLAQGLGEAFGTTFVEEYLRPMIPIIDRLVSINAMSNERKWTGLKK